LAYNEDDDHSQKDGDANDDEYACRTGSSQQDDELPFRETDSVALRIIAARLELVASRRYIGDCEAGLHVAIVVSCNVKELKAFFVDDHVEADMFNRGVRWTAREPKVTSDRDLLSWASRALR
jgi:hypothetical protein